ncbi:WD repeat domain-containing protein 83-like [Hibiscus syriacus]|uniref:WD repeat domain-containing protein 83-like n=1 Tax=Hibiscus syriacus TaxID=106335 RepID=UPI001924EAEF|nr:WD repeat domain-containing protein 83-like [Hibiscus syriacus]
MAGVGKGKNKRKMTQERSQRAKRPRRCSISGEIQQRRQLLPELRDNSKLCSCVGDRHIFYWDVSTDRVIRKFRGHDGEVNAVQLNEYASVVVSTGYDRSLRAWDCRSHSTEPIQIIDSFLDTVMSVCLTKTWSVRGRSDSVEEISDDLGQPVNCFSMSNDGNCILASCLDSRIRLLDRSTGELLQE